MDRARSLDRSRCQRLCIDSRRLMCGNVPDDFGQLAGTDLVKEAVELDVLRNRRALAKQPKVQLFEIHDGEAIVIKQRRDISVMMIMKLCDDQLRRQRRGTAKRMVNYNDVFDIKQIVHGRHGL